MIRMRAPLNLTVFSLVIATSCRADIGLPWQDHTGRYGIAQGAIEVAKGAAEVIIRAAEDRWQSECRLVRDSTLREACEGQITGLMENASLAQKELEQADTALTSAFQNESPHIEKANADMVGAPKQNFGPEFLDSFVAAVAIFDTEMKGCLTHILAADSAMNAAKLIAAQAPIRSAAPDPETLVQDAKAALFLAHTGASNFKDAVDEEFAGIIAVLGMKQNLRLILKRRWAAQGSDDGNLTIIETSNLQSRYETVPLDLARYELSTKVISNRNGSKYAVVDADFSLRYTATDLPYMFFRNYAGGLAFISDTSAIAAYFLAATFEWQDEGGHWLARACGESDLAAGKSTDDKRCLFSLRISGPPADIGKRMRRLVIAPVAASVDFRPEISLDIQWTVVKPEGPVVWDGIGWLVVDKLPGGGGDGSGS